MNAHQKHSATGQGQVMQPGAMTDTERLDEIAQLSATGLLRLTKRAKKSGKKRQILGDNCLAVPAEISPHVSGPSRS